MITTTKPRAEFRDLSIEEYHRDLTHDSNSSLRLFRKRPTRYYHQRISKRIKPKETTDEQQRGNACHAGLLEPHKLESTIKVIPSEVLASNGARSGNAWKAWKEENAAFIPFTAEQYDLLMWQIEAVWQNPRAKEVLEAATTRERSIFWTSPDGHTLKCRLDAADELSATITDVKRTGRDDSDFHYSVKDFGYGNQAAIYCDGYRAMYGIEPTFQLLIVDDDPPFDCRIRTFPAAAIELGREQNAETLRDLYACKRGERSWIRPEDHEVRELYLPPWHYARSVDPTEVEVPSDY